MNDQRASNVAGASNNRGPSNRRDSLQIGGFSQSFLIHMIRDFFILLVVVMVVELGIRLFLVLYRFDHDDRMTTGIAAERLATDVRSIMLNEGGPVAARTLYPILQRNHRSLNLTIAIQPAPVTVSSIVSTFGFSAKGIQADWPEGRYHESRVNLHAEAACLACHVGAKVGDVLGTVIVRNDLSSHLARWWEEVRLSGMLGLGKILLHTLVLYFLLKARMEPVLSLRSVVARLAKAGSGLSRRAVVKSRDEFGELTQDLNLFLDRVSHIVEDLSTVLSKVGALNHRLSQTQFQMSTRMQQLRTSVSELAQIARERHPPDAILSAHWLQTVELVLSAISNSIRQHGVEAQFDQRINAIAAEFHRSAQAMREALAGRERLGDGLIKLSDDLVEITRCSRLACRVELRRTLLITADRPHLASTDHQTSEKDQENRNRDAGIVGSDDRVNPALHVRCTEQGEARDIEYGELQQRYITMLRERAAWGGLANFGRLLRRRYGASVLTIVRITWGFHFVAPRNASLLLLHPAPR